MAYTAPDLATFIAVFPAFSSVTPDQYAFWSAQAVIVTEPLESCLDARMDLATMLATAHYLVLSGVGTGAESQTAAEGMAGFKRIKSGSLELERSDSSGSNDSEWMATSYGKRLYPMLRACLSGPRVVSSGSLPCGYGYNGFAGALPPWVR